MQCDENSLIYKRCRKLQIVTEKTNYTNMFNLAVSLSRCKSAIVTKNKIPACSCSLKTAALKIWKEPTKLFTFIVKLEHIELLWIEVIMTRLLTDFALAVSTLYFFTSFSLYQLIRINTLSISTSVKIYNSFSSGQS